MLLVIDEKHKTHLSFLKAVPVEVVKEFCRISVEFIKKGANPKMYQSAANKLGVETDSVQYGVEGLMYLFIECSKLMVSETDFMDSIMPLSFSEELTELLLDVYQNHKVEIREMLSEMSMQLPHYHDLEWRLDVVLASRSLRHQVTPLVTLKLHTVNNGENQIDVLQTDPVNLLHLTQTLEEALQEIKTGHCRRILRNI